MSKSYTVVFHVTKTVIECHSISIEASSDDAAIESAEACIDHETKIEQVSEETTDVEFIELDHSM